MKKKIALLLLLMLALTAIFASCAQPEATKVIPRWDDKLVESYEYTISLADFNLSSDGTIAASHFSMHNFNSEAYYKDFDVRVGEPLSSQDEVRPSNAVGKFTLTISHPERDYDLLTTTQELEITYDNKDGKLIAPEVLEEMQKNNLIVSNSGDSITLRSSTVTSVEFKHSESQSPRRSSTTVLGFYIGKVHQEVSNYEIATEYTYEDRNTQVAITLTENGDKDNAKTIENTLKRQTEGSFIDSNQLFTYARSLDKSSTSFQNSPSVSVYNPLTQSMHTATFSFAASANAVLNDQSRNEQLYVKIPTLGVIIDGMAFMLQESVPALKEKLPDLFDEQGIGPDVVLVAGYPYAKHTPVRFRVGYISYELTHYNDEIWNALKSLMNDKK